jgi:hypothetical protein
MSRFYSCFTSCIDRNDCQGASAAHPDRSTHRDVVCVHRLRFRHLAHCPNQCISTSNKIGAQGAYSATLDLPAPIPSDISTAFTPLTGRARYSMERERRLTYRQDHGSIATPIQTFNVQCSTCLLHCEFDANGEAEVRFARPHANFIWTDTDLVEPTQRVLRRWRVGRAKDEPNSTKNEGMGPYVCPAAATAITLAEPTSLRLTVPVRR